MATIIIDDIKSPQAKQFLEFAKTLPFATVIEEKKENFREATDECDAVLVSIFIDELRRRVDEHFENA